MKQAWLKGLRWRAPVRMRHAAAAGGLAAALAAALWLWSEGGASTFPVAYVVCSGDYRSESRAYRVDLLAGELTDVSEPLEWVGAPHHLDYDPVRSRLYFASMNKKWSPPMWPVTSLRAGGGEFEVAGRFPTSRENNLLEKARAGEAPPSWRMGMPEAYSVIVSPDGRELYVSYGGLSDTGMLAEVWDADTGEILRGLPSVISSEDPWSPDGNHVAVIWPSYDGKPASAATSPTQPLGAGLRSSVRKREKNRRRDTWRTTRECTRLGAVSRGRSYTFFLGIWTRESCACTTAIRARSSRSWRYAS